MKAKSAFPFDSPFLDSRLNFVPETELKSYGR